MANIKLGKRPKNFKHTVKFPLIEGGEGALTINFIYRTRKEFGAFVDELTKAAGLAPIDPSAPFTMEGHMMKMAGANADYVFKVAEGWDLEEEFTRENALQLADEQPAAALAIMEAYSQACTQGRLGN